MLLQVEDYLGRAGQDEHVSVPVAVLERMRRTGYRISQMTNDLLDVSRIELGRLSLDRRPVELPRAVEALLAQMALNLGGHPVSVEIRGDVPPILADPGRLDQILMNLVENAVKYSGPPPHRDHRRSDRRRRRRDRGGPRSGDHCGRADQAVRPLLPGAARSREEERPRPGPLHRQGARGGEGGRIWVDSDVGQGSWFDVWLPAAEPRPAYVAEAVT